MNRLNTVVDSSGTTTYGYDAVGNLQGYTYPNGVLTSYNYDALNRLTQMGSSKGSPLSSYAYTLGATGNRTSVAELSGRTVAYGYDSLYRLTSEAISADPHGNNGTVSYAYDSVGNRQQMNSTLSAIPGGVFFYNQNDQLTTDTYDANGNTTSFAGITNVYDFENHMLQKGAVTIVYDGDGNRVAETVGGVTTKYLVDTQNPTGYAQVVDELQNGAVSRTYSYGLERISQKQSSVTSFYGYDGHGSVRFLTNSAGTITDTYDYDAFGNLINQTGSTPNNYLFAGEQVDFALGLYYNRARYLNTNTGRFWSMDPNEGDPESPASLHKYLYANGDPVDNSDPGGRESLVGALGGISGGFTIDAISVLNALKVVGFVSSAILVGVGVSAEIDVIRASRAQAQQLVQERTRVRTRVEASKTRPKARILFHYTTKENAESIQSLGVIYVFPGIRGTGAYATNLAGWLGVETLRRPQLVEIIFGRNTGENYAKTAWFVAFEEAPGQEFDKVLPFIYLHEAPETEIIPLYAGPNLLVSELMYPLQVTERQWFELRLRVEGLERNSEAIKYIFVFESSSKQALMLKCYVCYDPDKLATMGSVDEDERREIFREWRKTVVSMIGAAMRDTPGIRSKFSVDRDLQFVVLEGYGMGSKKVFEDLAAGP